MLRITTNYQEFYRTVKIILDRSRLRQIGLPTDDISGTFRPPEMDDVMDFCANSPRFHVVSYLGEGVFINRYDERGILFKVADGDNDPNYMLDARAMYRWMLPYKYPEGE